MMSLFHQSIALTKANLLSLPRRFWISFSMVFSVALVVVVLLGFLSLANGFRHALTMTGAPDVALIMSRGSLNEATSRITAPQLRLLESAPGIDQTEQSAPMLSAELVVPVDAVRRTSGDLATLSLRGIGPNGFALRPSVLLTEGRQFQPGSNEIIIGGRLAQDYENTDIGNTISFGTAQFTVVGHFSADGGVFESEMLADAGVVQTLFNRQNSYQSVRLKLTDPSHMEQLGTFMETTPRLAGLHPQSEQDFFAVQAQTVSQIVLWLGWPLAATMAIGAAIGALTTMYSSVSDRSVEIATVRALGFSRTAAFSATLAEGLFLTIIGAATGSLVGWLALDGIGASTRSGGASTQLSFELTLSWIAVGQAGILALCVGLIGAGLPALRATRVPLRLALSRRT